MAILFVDAAPEDSAGEWSGPLLALGSIMWILIMVIGTVVAVAFRKPPAAEPPAWGFSGPDEPVHAGEGVAVAQPPPGP